MKKLLKAWILCFVLCSVLLTLPAQAAYEGKMVRVGLFYADSALATANLENSVGSGYRFGYYNSSSAFVPLGNTSETQISMLKTQNIYLKSGVYYSSDPGGSDGVVGCYHIQLSGTYESFDTAKSAAAQVSNGFPAWISGSYVVRVGSYPTKDAALAAQSSIGQGNTSVVGTSSYGITVTKTKTTTILFQFDSAGSQIFAVNPGLDDSSKTITWFKGYKYYGDFLYERIGGGNLTVVNYLPMDDYVKGILPYEMSPSWPLEALKAQAVCARSYTVASTGSKHSSHHFEICNTICCQVYRGLNNASDLTNRAVDETSGIYAWYQGGVAQTFYYAANGGASEDVRNVWSSTANMPYLSGAIDPYESSISGSIPGYQWTVSFTNDKLTSLLQSKGYQCGSIVDLKVTQYTPLGNVLSIAFVDDAGKTFAFSRERARTILGLKSLRFQISGGSGSGGVYYVDTSGSSMSKLEGLWSVGESGAKAQLGETLYAITSAGTETLRASSDTSPGLFTITGTGNGHHIGMSQWGANAMAKQGFTYDKILKFYFAGIDLN